jgi:diguanylate cyclase (GGDEF)-like protein/PAS domain S-box-containing protein
VEVVPAKVPRGGAVPSLWSIGFLVVGCTALAAYYAGPSGLLDWEYDGIGLASAAALAWRAWVSGPRARLTWTLLATGVAFWVVGDLALTSLEHSHNGTAPFPSYADAIYLAGYPAIAAAAVRAGRQRAHPQDRGAGLEALMIALAVAVPVYAFWIAPGLAGSGLTASAVVSTAYPLLDLVVVAAAARLALASSRLSPVAVLLLAGLGLNVLADVIFNVQLLAGTYATPSPIDSGWMLGYLCWGAAALHPTAATYLQPAGQPSRPSDRRRMVLLGLIVTPPLAVIGRSYIGGAPLDTVALVGALLAISIVMAVRLRDMARSGSTRWRSSAILFTAAFLGVAIAGGLAQIQLVGRERTAAIQSLLRARAQLERANGIATEIRATERPATRSARAGFASATHAVDRVIDDLDSDAPGGYPKRGLDAGVHTYIRAAGREQRLLARHHASAAARLDRARVRPAYVRLAASMDGAQTAFERSASRAVLIARLGTVLVLAIAFLVLSLLFRKFTGVRREIERAEERARSTAEGENRLRALLAGSADVTTIIDAETTVIAHPESVERVFGQPAGSMLGSRLDALLEPEDRTKTAAILAKLSHSEPGTARAVDWCVRCGDGTTLAAEALISNHLDVPHLNGFVLNLRDVTDRRRLESELQHRAFHDHLTGLANRALLEDRLRHALGRSARSVALHAIVFLDLDDFKAVNDSLGHSIGDELLIEVGRRLQSCLRSADTLARIGGDEFAVLLEEMQDTTEALDAARRLLDTLRQPFRLAGDEHLIGASAGVALSDGSGAGSLEERASRVLRNSDLAMYEAKRLGNRSVELFAPEMHDVVSRRLKLRSELELGLARGEFVIHYQPIVALADRSVVGFEALVRWNHPTRGLVPPNDFIPVAETTGLIIELGHSVLRGACRQLAEWNERWPERRYMSVNVAGQQLQRDSFLTEVADAIAESGIAPEQLLLEVTETALVQDSEGNEQRMRALRALGVRLAIDDFGTGYSALNYLRQFSMDVLKIDKSFIDSVGAANRDSALVDAMVSMGNTLDLRVVAEGIEAPEQAEALMRLGCALGQGYLFARPSTATQIEDLLALSRAGRLAPALAPA